MRPPRWRFRKRRDRQSRRSPIALRTEALEPRVLMAADGPWAWQNATQPADVDADGTIAPLDAALVLYALSRGGPRSLATSASPPPTTAEAAGHLDVNGDTHLDVQDAQAVLDALNSPPPGSSGGVLAEAAQEGESQVRYRVEITDDQGSPLTEVSVDDVFTVNVYVQDLRTDPSVTDHGAFSAFVDLAYQAELAEASSDITFGPVYGNSNSGTVTDGVLDEVGGISGTEPVGPQEELLFSIQMTATAAGSLTFTANAADENPQHETVLFGGVAAVPAEEIDYGSATLTVQGEDSGPAQDLVAFAKALTDAGVKFYGAIWCPHCNAQKKLFEDGAKYLPYIEASNPDKTPNQVAIDNNITSYPTWVFPDETRLEGEQTLETLAEHAGIEIPTGDSPSFAEIDDVTLLGGSPLHLALDGYDPDADPLTYTVTSSDPALVAPTLFEDNRSLRMQVQGYGDMVFQLFDDRAPRATERIATLAQDDFYDGTIFHRVLDDFVIQGGDPTGTGSGGSPLDDFDDQFHPDLQHNRTGVLSMAKSFDDTNDSQFFITEGAQRHLDFNHTIFGLLLEGESTREGISEVPVNAPTVGRPTTDVVIEDMEVFDDTENAVLMLKAPEGATGEADITVTVTDQDGNTFQQTFHVTVEPDTVNGGPYMEDIEEPIETDVVTEVTFQVNTVDVEGDPVTLSATAVGGVPAGIEVNNETGEITVTPPAFMAGDLEIRVEARAAEGAPNDTADKVDTQVVTIHVTPSAPLNLQLASTHDSGASDSDGLTNVTEAQFDVSGIFSGALIEIFAGDIRVGAFRTQQTGTVTAPASDFDLLADGEYTLRARQEIDGLFSEFGEPITVTIDRTAPVALDLSGLATATAGQPFSFDLDHPEESSTGFRYELRNAPEGMTIGSADGLLNWTPPASPTGNVTFEIITRDPAGNQRINSASLLVASAEPEVQFRLEATDMDGTPITSIESGQSFLLKAFVRDLADPAVGIFAAYLDVGYNPALATVTGDITHGEDFGNGPSGTTTTDGLIDEAGSADGTEPLGEGDFLLWTIPMRADAVGTLNFTGNPADQLPQHAVLRANETTPIAPEDIQFQGVTLTIVEGLTAVDDALTVDEDSTDNVLDVLANDQAGPSGGTITITEVGTPSEGGTATVSEDGTHITYTPAADFTGTETFTYTITNEDESVSEATVSVTVNNVNDPPTAVDDTASTGQETAVTIDVLANDSSDPDPDETLTITEVGTPSEGGTASIVEGKIEYTPAEGFTGTEEFTYTISDPGGLTATATVTVTISQVNQPPTAGDDALSMDEDATLTIQASDLLENDSPGPASESSQTLTIISVTSGSSGTATLNEDGTITFQPEADFFGTATFTYTVQDDGTTGGEADPKTATGTVTITVNPVGDDPTAADDTASMTSGDDPIDIDVLANDSIEPDTGETLTITEVSEGSEQGTITIVDDGARIRYQPREGFSGTETFTYTISDGNGGTAQATVTVEVEAFQFSSLAGVVYMDANNNGTQDSGERGLSGVTVKLDGVDLDGAEVHLTQTSDKDGKYLFDQLKPGTYTVTQVQPMFLMDGKDSAGSQGSTEVGNDSITIQLGNQAVTGVDNNFGERGLTNNFLIWEALASRTDQGVLLAVDAEGNSTWSNLDEGWERFISVEAHLSSDGQSVTIVGTEPNGNRFETTTALTDSARIRVMGGQSDGSLLVRVTAPSTSFEWVAEETTTATDAAFAEL